MGRDVPLLRGPGLTPDPALAGMFLSEDGLQGRARGPCQLWGRDATLLCTTPGLSLGVTSPSVRFFPKLVDGGRDRLRTPVIVLLGKVFLTPADVFFPS